MINSFGFGSKSSHSVINTLNNIIEGDGFTKIADNQVVCNKDMLVLIIGIWWHDGGDNGTDQHFVYVNDTPIFACEISNGQYVNRNQQANASCIYRVQEGDTITLSKGHYSSVDYLCCCEL